MRILISGGHGYLGTALIKEIDNVYCDSVDVIYYGQPEFRDGVYTDIDKVIHFASPSCESEFQHKGLTASTMIDLSLKMINIALVNNAEFIFASTQGVSKSHGFIDDISDYIVFKNVIERYLNSMMGHSKYKILRLPRIYSSCRQKGLIGLIKNNQVPISDFANIVEYNDLDDMIKTIIVDVFDVDILTDQSNIIEYTTTYKQSVAEISDKYC